MQRIVEEIIRKHILPESLYKWYELKGGTNSTVGALGTESMPNMYVIKSNSVEQIDAEYRFYKRYDQIALLPKVNYVDPEFHYMIYDYIPGATNYKRGTKQALMFALVDQMIQHYVQPEQIDDYEWIEDPMSMQQNINYTHSIIGSQLSEEDHQLVKEIHVCQSKRMSKEGLYVLHGDFGVHNFLFENGALSGIIDPIPVVGRPLYDLLYAFCSSPDDLNLSVISNAVERMDLGYVGTTHELIEDTILALYSRIGTCLTYHPEDLLLYQIAWKEWRQIWNRL